MATTNRRAEDDALVQDLEAFLRSEYEAEVAELAQQYPRDKRSIWVDYRDLYRFDPDVADDLQEKPGRVLDLFQEALQRVPVPVEREFANATVRVAGLSDVHEYDVGDPGHNRLSEFISLYGQISKKSEKKPRVETAAFECERCGTLTRISQSGEDMQEPHECQGCDRQGPFRLHTDQSEMTNYQAIKLQRPPERAVGGQGASITVQLKGDLCDTVEAGDRITATGTYQIDTRDLEDPPFEPYLQANALEPEETDFEDIEVDEHEAEIQAIASGDRGDPLEVIVDSIAPKLQGLETVKEAIALQLLGGVSATHGDGSSERGDSHILLLGDPGCGKSTLLRAVESIAPRSTHASGKGASAAGLTGAVVPDDFGDSKWSLQAGALVLSNKGIACIDELDKSDEETTSSLHDALESQKVEVSKADINATLPAETALLAAGNPKYGRFDHTQSWAEQIDLDPALISRFDLMFMLSDEPDDEEDTAIAEHMIESRRAAVKRTHDDAGDAPDVAEPAMELDLLRAYIAYARQEVHPTIEDAAVGQKIADWYTELRGAADVDSPVPVTARKIEAIERLAEASARARLSETVDAQDAERAGQLVMNSMRDVGIDPETGDLDVDVIETGMSKSQRDRVKTVLDIIKELAAEYNKGAPEGRVIEEALDEGMDREQAEHEIEILKQKGEVYTPHSDHLKVS